MYEEISPIASLKEKTLSLGINIPLNFENHNNFNKNLENNIEDKIENDKHKIMAVVYNTSLPLRIQDTYPLILPYLTINQIEQLIHNTAANCPSRESVVPPGLGYIFSYSQALLTPPGLRYSLG